MSSRLFGVGIEGTSLETRERAILERDPPFGLILFRRNVESTRQVRELIGEARRLGARLAFVDQEGGPVDRLKDLLAPFPSFRAAASAGRGRRAGELAGSALAFLGIDVDLAPVVDRGLPQAGALVLGERCASADPAEIVRAGAEFLEGLHSRGIAGCLKHFPGLGRAGVDTHRELPILAEDPREEELDLVPFEELGNAAGAVMISHAAGKDGLPASLSPSVATGLLRDRVGFSGAAFSDDLEMGALDRFGDLPARCVAASRAGCDLLFVCRRIEIYPDCVRAVELEVSSERRTEARRRLEEYAVRRDGLAAAAAPVNGSAALLLEAIERFRGELPIPS